MTSLADHPSNSYVKLLAIGDAKSGKTGSLVSLVKAGYKLRILDLDNLLDVLKYLVLHECPDLISNVEVRTIRDKYKSGNLGTVIDGRPRAWVDAIRLCDNWKYIDESGAEINYGPPHAWGPDCILVIDSFSRLCDAAYTFHESIIPKGKSGDFDGRAVYGNAQDDAEKFLAQLTSKEMATNVIVIAHVTYQLQPDGTTKGFPQGVGQRLSPKVPQYFPSVILYTQSNGKRTINTASTRLMDLANPRPFAMGATYPIETGLADFFAVLRDPPQKEAKETPPSRPTSVTLIRK
jgi:hypothetical protein